MNDIINNVEGTFLASFSVSSLAYSVKGCQKCKDELHNLVRDDDNNDGDDN